MLNQILAVNVDLGCPSCVSASAAAIGAGVGAGTTPEFPFVKHCDAL